MDGNKSQTPINVRENIVEKKMRQAFLKIHILHNHSFEKYLNGLTSTIATDYYLWKTTEKIKEPQQHIPTILSLTGRRVGGPEITNAKKFTRILWNN